MTQPSQPGNETGTVTPPAGQGQPAVTGATPPAYATREEMEAFKNELKAALSKNYQGVQKETGSFQSRVQNQLKGIQDTLKQLQAVGVQVTPDQARAMQQQALLDAFQQEPPEQQPVTAPGQGQPTARPGAETEPALTPEQQAVTDAAYAIMETMGVEIADEDPEVAIINKALTGTPRQYFDAIREACKAKQARLQASSPITPQPNQPPALPANPAPRMPGLTSGGTGAANPISSINDPDQLWNLATGQGRR